MADPTVTTNPTNIESVLNELQFLSFIYVPKCKLTEKITISW